MFSDAFKGNISESIPLNSLVIDAKFGGDPLTNFLIQSSQDYVHSAV